MSIDNQGAEPAGSTSFGRRGARTDDGAGYLAPKPKRAKAARSQLVVFLNFMMTLLVLALIGTGALLWYGKQQFNAPGPLKQDTAVAIRKGAGMTEIANTLARQNVITDPRIFAVGVRASGNASSLKAGEYEFKAGASMRDVMDTIRSGKAILHALTIPEGLTVEQAWAVIRDHPVLTGDMPATMPGEGMLMADTLKFSRGMTREEAVERLVADQKAMVEDVWAKRRDGLPVKDVNEFVTLASIVEKETGVAAERPQVAAVFVNRLNQGMRLQSDPTILYGIYGGKGKPAGAAITRSQIDTPTDYNTYTIDGLPPGPIAIPGRAALEAVANPADTSALFFVADGTGGHAFAETLDEHNANVRAWRKIEAERAASQGNTATEPAAQN